MSITGRVLKCGLGLLAAGAIVGTASAQDANDENEGLEEVPFRYVVSALRMMVPGWIIPWHCFLMVFISAVAQR